MQRTTKTIAHTRGTCGGLKENSKPQIPNKFETGSPQRAQRAQKKTEEKYLSGDPCSTNVDHRARYRCVSEPRTQRTRGVSGNLTQLRLLREYPACAARKCCRV